MTFNKDKYLHDINLDLEIRENYPIFKKAMDSLELLITRSEIAEAIELKKLRHPIKVAQLELNSLKKSGFDFTKEETINGETYPAWLVCIERAKYRQARLSFPHLVDRFNLMLG